MTLGVLSFKITLNFSRQTHTYICPHTTHLPLFLDLEIELDLDLDYDLGCVEFQNYT